MNYCCSGCGRSTGSFNGDLRGETYTTRCCNARIVSVQEWHKRVNQRLASAVREFRDLMATFGGTFLPGEINTATEAIFAIVEEIDEANANDAKFQGGTFREQRGKE